MQAERLTLKFQINYNLKANTLSPNYIIHPLLILIHCQTRKSYLKISVLKIYLAVSHKGLTRCHNPMWIEQ